MKNRIKTLAAAFLSLAAVSLNAEVFQSTYTVEEGKDWNLVAQMLIGPGVARHPDGLMIAASNPAQVGVFSNLVAQVIPSFTNGVILSTGKIKDGMSLLNERSDAQWQDDEFIHPPPQPNYDEDLDGYFEEHLNDPAGIVLYIQPKNTTINIPFVMASEEFYLNSSSIDYPTQEDYEDYSDKFAFFLKELGDASSVTNAEGKVIDNTTDMKIADNGDKSDWWNIAQFTNTVMGSIETLDIEISSVNQHTNTEYFISNVSNENGNLVFPASDIKLPMEFNGAIVGPVAVAKGLDTNKIYKLKIVIGDGGYGIDNSMNSVVFLRERGITSGADLKVDVEGPHNLTAAGTATFTDTISNIGPVSADGVKVTHYLPAGVDPSTVSITCDGVPGDPAAWGIDDGRDFFEWTIGDRFMPGSNVVLSITCTLPDTGVYTNRAHVVTTTGDYDGTNDKDDHVTTVGALPTIHVTITAKDATKTYNGSALTQPEFTVEGLDASDDHVFTVAMSADSTITDVGTQPNVIATVDGVAVTPGTETAVGSYLVTVVNGELSVTPKRVTITAKNASKAYDGSALTQSAFTASALQTGDTHVFAVVMTAESTITDVGTQPNVIATVDDVEVTPGTPTMVGNYLVTTANGELEVVRKEVTLTAKDASKTYDGSALTQPAFTASALEAGDAHAFTVAMTAASTITDVGTQPNVIATVDGVEVTTGTATEVGNYLVTTADGELGIVRKPVTITAQDASKTYDGTALTQPAFTASALEAGDDHAFTVAMTAESTITDVGTQPNVIATVDGVAVTPGTATEVGNYLVTTANGELKIDRKAVTITAKDASKTYDGSALTQPEFTASALEAGDTHVFTAVMTADSTITHAGTQPNVIATVDGVAVTSGTATEVGNYLVTTANGELEIDRKAVTITAKDASKVFDGSALTQPEFTASALETGDTHVFTVAMTAESTITDVGTQPNVIATVDGVAVTPGTATEVGDYLVTTVNGTLDITLVVVTITAKDATKTYDGSALAQPEFTVSGLTADAPHTFAVAMTADSTITDVGTQPNVIATVDGVAVTPGTPTTVGNYTVTVVNGELSVTPKRVTLTAKDATKTYDGSALTQPAFTASALQTGDTHVFEVAMTAESTITDVGTQPNVIATVDGVEVTTGTPTMVGNYLVTTADGELEVTRKAVTLTAQDASKTYDGTELTQPAFTASALEAGDTHVFTVAMTEESTITDVGTQPNVIATVDDVEVESGVATEVGNYLVTTVDGELEVTRKAVTLTAQDASKKFDGSALTQPEFTASALEAGDTHVFEVAMTADSTITDVGTQPNVIATVDGVAVTRGVATEVGGYLVTTVDGELEITPVVVTITAKDASKTYDGSALTQPEYTVDGLEAGDTHAFDVAMTADSTITDAGTQPNVIATVDGVAVAPGVATAVGNYLVTAVNGELEIIRKEVTLTAKDASKTYDGSALTQPEFTASALEAGDTHVFTVAMTAESTITDVGTQPNVIATVDGVAVASGTATAVGNYLVTTVNGTLDITLVVVTITAKDATKTYDGSALTQPEFTVSGLTADAPHTFAVAMTADSTITDVGTQPNVIATVDGVAVTPGTPTTVGNYTVTVVNGELSVTPKRVTITAKSASKAYDGSALTQPEFTASALQTGDTHVFEVAMTAESTITDVGTQPNVIATVDDVEVTTGTPTMVGNYLVTTADGELEVTRKIVTITAQDASKAYDGSALTQPEFTTSGLESGDTHVFTVEMTADSTITDVGTQPNVIATVDGVDVTPDVATEVGNYLVTTANGELEVTRKEVTITAKDASKTYDGTALTQSEFTTSALEAGDDHVFTVEMTADSTITDVGTQPNVIATVDGVTVAPGVATEVGGYLVTTVAGELKINPVTVTITAKDASKTYDGTALTQPEYTVDGLEAGDAHAFTVAMTADSTITDAGTQPNVIATVDGVEMVSGVAAAVGNYLVTTVNGELEIVRKEVTLTAKDASKTYDGTALTQPAFTASALEAGDTHVFTVAMTADSTITDVGTRPNVIATVDGVAVASGTATEVGNYRVTTADGELKINPVVVTITAKDATKTYDGTALTQPEYAVDGLAAGDAHVFAVVMTEDSTITDVGTQPNVIAAVDDVAVVPGVATPVGNYLVTTGNGELSVTPKRVTLTAKDASKAYDGAALTQPEFTASALQTGDTHVFEVAMTADSTITDVGTQPNVIATVDGVEVTTGTPTMVGNYLVTTADGELEVTRKAVTLTAKDASKVWDGAALTQPEFTTSALGADDDHVFTVEMTADSTITDVGTQPNVIATVDGVAVASGVATEVGNYLVTTADGELEITPVVVTITANSASKVYDGNPLTEGGFTVEGLGAGDDHVFTVAMTADSTITDVGTQPNVIATVDGVVVVTGVATVMGNYSVTTVDGELKILGIPLTITAHDKAKAYGEEVTFDGTTEFDVSGLQGDDHVASVTLESEGAAASAVYKAEGYPIKASNAQGTGLDKYAITYVDGTLTISKRELLITANDATKAYGEVLTFTGGTNEFTVVGDLQNGEEVLSVTITSEKAADPGTEVGEYADEIVPFFEVTGIDTNNYDIVFSNGTLTVTQAVLTITVNDVTWKVGTPRPEYSFADFSSELKAEDTVADITGGTGLATDVEYSNVVWTASVPTHADVRTYADEIWLDPASLDGARAANYAIVIDPGDLTIHSADPELKTSISASLNWDTGLLDLELTVSNVGDGEVDPDSDYWVQLRPGEAANGGVASVERTYYLDSPMGTLADGSDYIDLTAAVKAALRSVGNGDEVFDAGETVKLTGVSVYHWKRWPPEKFIHADTFFVSGRLNAQQPVVLENVEVALKNEADVPGETHVRSVAPVAVAPATLGALGAFTASSAATYNGWLRDGAGRLVALLQVKTTKVSKEGAYARSVISVTPFDGSRKRTYRTSILPGGNPTDEFGVTYGDLGLGGALEGCTVMARRDFAKAKAGTPENALAQGIPVGVWTLAFADASGYDAFSVTTSKNGKTKVVGTLSDGKKVSITAQGVLGDDNVFAIPVMNAKKGVGFVAWLDRAGNMSISDLAVSGWTFVESGKLRDSWATANVVFDASSASSQVSALRISYNSRTGVAQGSFKLSWAESGKAVNANVKLSGVVVSGRLYATASARNLGTFKVTTSQQ